MSITDPIPTGATERGVNATLLKLLRSIIPQNSQHPYQILDVPCGQGELLKQIQSRFPNAIAVGGDLMASTTWTQLGVPCFAFDATQPWPAILTKHFEHKFDCILSISGLMEFDATSRFIKNCIEHLAPGGTLILSNDNSLTVRDRFSYFFLGRVRRYSLFFRAFAPTFHHVSISELYKNCLEIGLELKEVRYVSIYPEDWLFLPIALLIWPFQYLKIIRDRVPIPISTRLKLIPFRSLLARHYFLICQTIPSQK